MNGDGGKAAALEPEILTPDQIAVPAVSNVAEIEALAQRYAAEAQGDLTMAQAVQVTDGESYEQAGQLRVAIDRKRKGGEGVVELVCGPLYQRWKDFRTLLMAPVTTRVSALKVISDKRLTYEREEQRKADELRREQERLAKEEQDRLTRLAEQRAQRAEAKGDLDKAQEIRETVPQVSLPVVTAPVVAKTKGVAKTTYWHATVTDLAALVTAVAAGEVPLEAVQANEAWLNKTASALKQSMKYSGVRVTSEERERSTGR